MQQKRIVIVGPAVLALVLAGISGATAQGAKAIMEKANAVVSGAKTYQANQKMQMSLGTLGSTTLNVDMKIVPGKKANINTSADPNAKGTGNLAMASALFSRRVVDDG